MYGKKEQREKLKREKRTKVVPTRKIVVIVAKKYVEC